MINQREEDGIIIAAFENGKFNSITRETLVQLKNIVARANGEEAIKGIILTGTGKVYCSGFDLPMFLAFRDLDEVVQFFDFAEDVFLDLFMCSKPVVAAINGAAMAGGIIISMAADYRILKNHPKIQVGMTENKIGLGLTVVQSGLMRYGLGSERNFREVIYDGNRHNPENALRLGIVDELAEEDRYLARAKEVITGWIDNPGRAFTMLKYTLRKPHYDLMKEYLEKENWQQGLTCFFNPQTRATLEMVMKMMQ
jgi:enoyl-CoA hydratase/carnithine racemase